MNLFAIKTEAQTIQGRIPNHKAAIMPLVDEQKGNYLMAKAYLEITSALIRVYDDDSKQLGEPFDLSLAIVGHDDTAILKALKTDDVKLTNEHKTAIFEELLNNGFDYASWDRRKLTQEGQIERRDIKVPLRKLCSTK